MLNVGFRTVALRCDVVYIFMKLQLFVIVEWITIAGVINRYVSAHTIILPDNSLYLRKYNSYGLSQIGQCRYIVAASVAMRWSSSRGVFLPPNCDYAENMAQLEAILGSRK